MGDHSVKHRCRRARERSGLSVGQAAHLLGMERDDLWDVERSIESPAEALVTKMVDIYGIRAEWILGTVPQRDYEAVRRMPGWQDLCFADRDEIAEFVASSGCRSASTLVLVPISQKVGL